MGADVTPGGTAPIPGNGAAAQPPAGKTVKSDAAGRIYLSSMIGSELMNDKGDNIGKINDILVDKEGRPELLVSLGGFLGIGDREVLVPWRQLTIRRTERGPMEISLPMTKDDLKSVPEYNQ